MTSKKGAAHIGRPRREGPPDTSRWKRRERLEALKKAAEPCRVWVHGVGWVDLK